MKQKLIETVQRAIVLYVKYREGRNYKGDNRYNLAYFNQSKFIPKSRKRDLSHLDSILNNDEIEHEADLAAAIVNYLKKTKADVLKYWFIQVRKSHQMRNLIHNAVFIHDPDLFVACQKGDLEAYLQRQETNHRVSAVDEPSQENIVELYVNTRRSEEALRLRVVNLSSQLDDSQRENGVLRSELKKHVDLSQRLQKKVDVIISKKTTLQNKSALFNIKPEVVAQISEKAQLSF